MACSGLPASELGRPRARPLEPYALAISRENPQTIAAFSLAYGNFPREFIRDIIIIHLGKKMIPGKGIHLSVRYSFPWFAGPDSAPL